ncbi:hypothetical protein KY289_004000 [Solanum tuberosum]|nr:hypothetical protein KY289_004000 [Solanum tuberosum]
MLIEKWDFKRTNTASLCCTKGSTDCTFICPFFISSIHSCPIFLSLSPELSYYSLTISEGFFLAFFVSPVDFVNSSFHRSQLFNGRSISSSLSSVSLHSFNFSLNLNVSSTFSFASDALARTYAPYKLRLAAVSTTEIHKSAVSHSSNFPQTEKELIQFRLPIINCMFFSYMHVSKRMEENRDNVSGQQTTSDKNLRRRTRYAEMSAERKKLFLSQLRQKRAESKRQKLLHQSNSSGALTITTSSVSSQQACKPTTLPVTSTTSQRMVKCLSTFEVGSTSITSHVATTLTSTCTPNKDYLLIICLSSCTICSWVTPKNVSISALTVEPTIICLPSVHLEYIMLEN